MPRDGRLLCRLEDLILGVLDADSNEPEAFDQTDLAFLRQACRFLEAPGK
ncbi:MAG: hypothetical protein J7M29_03040 [Verrucomicrobia bacterium]|nr:hypothetical protein [Verrucomicrobiota bacterium]